jgi:hypothetical protein
MCAENTSRTEVVGRVDREALDDDRCRGRGAVERDDVPERAVGAEVDDAPLLAVEGVDVALRVDLDAHRCAQLRHAGLGPRRQRLVAIGEPHEPVVAGVGDDNLPSHAGAFDAEAGARAIGTDASA